MHISATRLRVRKLRFLPAFMRENRAIIAQLGAAPGFRGGALMVERRFTFWTVSAWSRGDDMRAFRDSGAHRAAMPKLLGWCDEAAVAHWLAETFPDWDAVHARMATEGRASRLRHPSRRHDEFDIPKPRPWFAPTSIAPLSRTESTARAAE